MNMKKLILLVVVVCGLVGCGQDSDYIPYALTGFNVYAYDRDSNEQAFAGFATSNYISRKDGLSQCYDLAKDEASNKHWKNWTYICCTATSGSSCVTKVR